MERVNDYFDRRWLFWTAKLLHSWNDGIKDDILHFISLQRIDKSNAAPCFYQQLALA